MTRRYLRSGRRDGAAREGRERLGRNWGIIIIATVVVLLVLAYALGWFSGDDVDAPAATTAPPAAGTGTTR